MTNQLPNNNLDSKQSHTFRWVIAGVFMLIVLAISSYFSPYWMLYSFCEAATKRDVPMIDNLIDFPTLKENLKVQALSSAANHFHGDLTNVSSPWTIIGTVIGASVINTTIDTLTDPAVFDAELFAKVPSNLSPLQVLANMLANQQGSYESFDTFAFRPRNDGTNGESQITLTLAAPAFFLGS